MKSLEKTVTSGVLNYFDAGLAYVGGELQQIPGYERAGLYLTGCSLILGAAIEGMRSYDKTGSVLDASLATAGRTLRDVSMHFVGADNYKFLSAALLGETLRTLAPTTPKNQNEFH